MIIVAGYLEVDPDHRAEYLAECVEVTRAARDAEGCLDFHLSADPVEPGRINVFERWESVDAVETFRGDGPSDQQQGRIVGAAVSQYEIVATTSLT